MNCAEEEEKRALVETMRIPQAHRGARDSGGHKIDLRREGSLLGGMLLVGLCCTGLKGEEGGRMDVGFGVMASGVLRGSQK